MTRPGLREGGVILALASVPLAASSLGCAAEGDGGAGAPGGDDALGGGGSASDAGPSTGTTGGGLGGSGGATPPTPPADLERYLTGADADADVTPLGPGLIVMGGGADVDSAFRWQRDRVAGGDVVVLRTSGSDGYNGYLFDDIGGVDSVETLLVTTRTLANDPWVAARITGAEAVFMAGGDKRPTWRHGKTRRRKTR
ncbi:MAG: hypothetical protein AAGN82_21965 [Myxococcota bacterium]